MANTTDLLDMQEMKIQYEGGNTIDANTYINSLLHFTNIVQEVNKEISKENKVEVRIKATTQGSFIVDLIVQTYTALGGASVIFSKERLEYAKQVIETVSTVYKVAKHLVGNKPKKITNDKDSTVTIENNEGQIQVFDFRGANIYLSNPNVKTAISQEFATLEQDTSVTGLNFLDNKENEILKIERQEFYNLSTANENAEILADEKIITVDATLNISSLDLEYKKKWDFYYLGNKISAKVEDTVFGEKIDKGERFGKGDTFKVKMEIKQRYDDSVNAYINKSYSIIQILEHIERPSQGKLNI